MCYNRSVQKNRVRKILESLADVPMETGYLLVAILEAGYPASRKQIEKKIEEIRYRSLTISKKSITAKERHSFDSLLSNLKRDGLIEKEGKKWSITKHGRDRLKSYDSKYPDLRYAQEGSDNLMIVMFDIPERERGKRAWLRSALTNMGFKMVQQSVWAGKKKVSKRFLKDINKLQIAQYIDILTVTRSGSLRSFEPKS